MKKHIKKYSVLLNLMLFLVIFQFASCQKDTIESNDETMGEETIDITSSLTNLLFRSSLNDGNNGDFIDGGNCFSINFPFSVLVLDTEIVVENENSYQNVIDFIGATDATLNDIVISFPITIMFLDYSEVVITNYEELLAYGVQCSENEINSIDCTQIIYPLQFFTFNSETEITTTNSFTNDKELHFFINNLTGSDFLTIQYPVSVKLNNGTITETVSNEGLENLINNCVSEGANEIDDLKSDLAIDTWFVTYFFNEEDETSDYCNFEFDFSSDGWVSVSVDSTVLGVGDWNIIALGNITKVLLDFPNEIPFEVLNNDWDIINANNSVFELNEEEGNILKFERDALTCDGSSVEEIKNYLKTGSWYVVYYFDDDDATSNYCEYEFVFNEDGIATVIDGTESFPGVWYVGTNDDGTFIGLDFGDELPFYGIWNNWNVTNANLNTIETEVDCECGGMHYLTFGRTQVYCEEENNVFLEQTLQNGVWYVIQYLDNGVDETLDYYYYDISFSEDNTVTAIYGTEVINGTWSVIGAAGSLKLVLDFGNSIPFNELNTNWDVLDILTNQVKFENENGIETDTLTIIKL